MTGIPNRHVILSHGAHHGRAAGTYLAGKVVGGDALAKIPNDLVEEVPNTPLGAHVPHAVRRRTTGPEPQPHKKTLPVGASEPKEAKSDEMLEVVVEPEQLGTIEEEESTVPRTVKQLYALNKAALLELAGNLGLKPEKKTVRALRAFLRDHLEL